MLALAAAELEDRDYYREANVFWVPDAKRWDALRAAAKQPDIGKRIDEALSVIEAENPKLKGILDKRFARAQLPDGKLGELVDLVSTIGFGVTAREARDVLGQVYEYFLGMFASAEGRRGGMFVQSEEFIEAHGGQIGDVANFGQKANPTTWRLPAPAPRRRWKRGCCWNGCQSPTLQNCCRSARRSSDCSMKSRSCAATGRCANSSARSRRNSLSAAACLNRSIAAAQVMEELLQMARKFRDAAARGEQFGLSEDEVRFYDALAHNESAVREPTDETLKKVAHELAQNLRKNFAVELVLQQAHALSEL